MKTRHFLPITSLLILLSACGESKKTQRKRGNQ